MKKKLLSLALASIIVISMFIAAIPVTATFDASKVYGAPANNNKYWDTEAVTAMVTDSDKTWYGDGSASAFTISNIKEFAYFCSLVNSSEAGNFSGKFFYITCDLDLKDYHFRPLSYYKEDFRGHIIGKKNGVDGAPVTISNMITTTGSNVGFVQSMMGGSVQNINFEYAFVRGSGSNIGVACGRVKGGQVSFKNISVNNCLVRVAGVTGEKPAGFIVGQIISNGWAIVTIENCTISNSSFNSTAYQQTASHANTAEGMGGVIGATLFAGITLNIKNVTLNDCDILGASKVGGVIGKIGTVDSSSKVTIDGVTINGGKISHTAADGHAGAIIGSALDGATITNTTVNGLSLVSPEGTLTNVGKVVGYADGVTDTNANGVRILTANCDIAIDRELSSIGGGDGVIYDINAPIMDDGASIRTVNKDQGIRFTSSLDTTVIEAAKTAGLIKGYTFGTVIALNEQRGDNDSFTAATLPAGSFTDVTANLSKVATENGYTFNGVASINSIALKNTQFAARSYVEVTLANDTLVRVYSDFDTAKNVRSMAYVANKALADVSDTLVTEDSTGFPYMYEVSFKNSDNTGETYTEATGTFYSRYTAAQCAVLKEWASVN